MKELAISLFVLTTSIIGFAQTVPSEKTKARVDAFKAAIPYPKFNIGDTLYIAFINDPELAISCVRPQDVDVLKVRISNMMLYTSGFGYKFADGAFLEDSLEEYPPVWRYQFYDCIIPNPKYGDRSPFYPEEQFATSPEAAKSILFENLKD